MKHYEVTVQIESDKGEEFIYVCRRPFHDGATQSEINYWADGVEYGTAIVHDGAVLEANLVCLD